MNVLNCQLDTTEERIDEIGSKSKEKNPQMCLSRNSKYRKEHKHNVVKNSNICEIKESGRKVHRAEAVCKEKMIKNGEKREKV